MRQFVFILTYFCSLLLNSQSDSLPYLKSKLKNASGALEKAQLEVRLSNAYINISLDSSRNYFDKAKALFPTTKSYPSEGENHLKAKIIGLEAEIYVKAGKLNDGEKIYKELLEHYGSYLTMKERAYCFLQLGVINDYQTNPVLAVKFYNKAFKIYDSISYVHGTSECLNNMAVIFYKQGESDKGIEYLERGLKMRRGYATKSEIADLLVNLGSMYLQKGNDKVAERTYYEGLELYKAENNAWGIAYALKSLAKYNIKMKNYERSLDLCHEILEKYTSPGDSSGIAMINSVISEAYYLSGDHKKSIKHGELAFAIASKMDVATRIYEASRILKEAYRADKNYKEALRFQTIYITLKDSMNSNQNLKETVKLRVEHEKEVEKLAYEKEILIKDSEAKRKNLILVFITIAFAMILLFSGLLLKKFKETKKQKKVIEEQKHLVEDKQKEILDSIRYAKRIQTALMTNEKYIERNLNKLKKS